MNLRGLETKNCSLLNKICQRAQNRISFVCSRHPVTPPTNRVPLCVCSTQNVRACNLIAWNLTLLIVLINFLCCSISNVQRPVDSAGFRAHFRGVERFRSYIVLIIRFMTSYALIYAMFWECERMCVCICLFSWAWTLTGVANAFL